MCHPVRGQLIAFRELIRTDLPSPAPQQVAGTETPTSEPAPAPTCLHATLIGHEQVGNLQVPVTERERQGPRKCPPPVVLSSSW